MSYSQHAFCHAGWTQEHASTFSYWSAIHGLVGLLVGSVLQVFCMCEGCRLAIVLGGAVLWELVEWMCTVKIGRMKRHLFNYEYRGDHWSNSVADVLMALVGYACARGIFLLADVECSVPKQ
jgi:uncharacterized membrane protein YjdF